MSLRNSAPAALRRHLGRRALWTRLVEKKFGVREGNPCRRKFASFLCERLSWVERATPHAVCDRPLLVLKPTFAVGSRAAYGPIAAISKPGFLGRKLLGSTHSSFDRKLRGVGHLGLVSIAATARASRKWPDFLVRGLTRRCSNYPLAIASHEVWHLIEMISRPRCCPT